MNKLLAKGLGIAALLWSVTATAAESEVGYRWLLVGRTFFDGHFEVVVVGTFTTKEACEAGAKDLDWLGIKGTVCLDRGAPPPNHQL